MEVQNNMQIRENHITCTSLVTHAILPIWQLPCKQIQTHDHLMLHTLNTTKITLQVFDYLGSRICRTQNVDKNYIEDSMIHPAQALDINPTNTLTVSADHFQIEQKK